MSRGLVVMARSTQDFCTIHRVDFEFFLSIESGNGDEAIQIARA